MSGFRDDAFSLEELYGAPSDESLQAEDLAELHHEQRKRVSDNPLDDDLRNTGFKVVANSGSYGDFAETNPADIDPDVEPTPRAVQVYAENDFTTYINRPERPGRFCFFPTASLVTAGRASC
jgi:hypothetical protein